MRFTEEIFEILSRGRFIACDSDDTHLKRYYDVIEEDFLNYKTYYQGIGFILESGHGYFFFSRKESRVDLERKIEALFKWIDYVSFFKSYDIAFGPGYVFREADIIARLNIHLDLQNQANKMFPSNDLHATVVSKLIKELESMNFVECINPLDATYKVLSSYRYIETMLESITLEEEIEDEVPE